MKLSKKLCKLGLPIFGAMAYVGNAFAGTGPDMPWDSGLDKLVKNLTGKTALAIGVLAMFAAAAALVFGGEMSEEKTYWLRSSCAIIALSSLGRTTGRTLFRAAL